MGHTLTLLGDPLGNRYPPYAGSSTKSKAFLQYNPDGSLTLYFGAKSPGKEKEPNWVPAPEGTFSLYIRAYWADGQEEVLTEYLCDWPGCANVAEDVLGVVCELRIMSVVCHEHAVMLQERVSGSGAD